MDKDVLEAKVETLKEACKGLGLPLLKQYPDGIGEWDTSFAAVIFGLAERDRPAAEAIDNFLAALVYVFPPGYTMKLNFYKTPPDAEHETMIQYSPELVD